MSNLGAKMDRAFLNAKNSTAFESSMPIKHGKIQTKRPLESLRMPPIVVGVGFLMDKLSI